MRELGNEVYINTLCKERYGSAGQSSNGQGPNENYFPSLIFEKQYGRRVSGDFDRGSHKAIDIRIATKIGSIETQTVIHH